MILSATQVKGAASNALKSFLGGNLFVSLFSAGALQYLWGLINALQMIVLTVLFNIDVAANADMIMVAIL